MMPTPDDDDMNEQDLQDLLADLPDEDIHELAALAEAMHEEAGEGE